MKKILVVNPGSTSTKIAVYNDEKPIFVKSISHPAEEVAQFERITDQIEFRTELIKEEVKRQGIALDFDAVVGRGGLAKPLEGGVYRVNQLMIDDMRNAVHQHAYDLGCIIADAIAQEIGCPSFIADPGATDELNDYARVCGTPLMQRICIWHALNQRAIARRFAKDHGKRYEDYNLIICHLGGGISIAAHEHGRAVDANNSLDGEGSFSPERAGTLPAGDLVRLCFSGKFTQEELLRRIAGQAGLTALLGTNDMREVERRIVEDHDKDATFYVDAMIYHTAKNIAAQGAVLCGKIDGIIITGGMARWKYLVEGITKRVEWMAPVYCYPGEDELEALALNALAALNGTVEAKEYV